MSFMSRLLVVICPICSEIAIMFRFNGATDTCFSMTFAREENSFAISNACVLLTAIDLREREGEKVIAIDAINNEPVVLRFAGPTDLSMKNTKPLLSHKLNATEMTAVKQLITGYRESAAFLLRSADELEQLLLQQP